MLSPSIMSFTVGTKDFRQALRAVSPHACRDSDLPMINRIRCYVDVENVTVAATDRFSAALGLVSVWDSSDTPVVGHIDLSLPDVAMILAVFTAGKDNGVDEPEWQLQIELLEKRTVTASDSPDVVSHAVRVTDVSGLIPGEVLERWSPGDRVELGPLPPNVVVEYWIARPWTPPLAAGRDAA
ncbi:hypothetical protein RND64_04545 [Gordonia sp. w5E2]|uniref:hypothetical protein n=1 Tax=Gordonia sp. w5E2 TaxID=3075837 RepID=UPI002F3FDC99